MDGNDIASFLERAFRQDGQVDVAADEAFQCSDFHAVEEDLGIFVMEEPEGGLALWETADIDRATNPAVAGIPSAADLRVLELAGAESSFCLFPRGVIEVRFLSARSPQPVVRW